MIHSITAKTRNTVASFALVAAGLALMLFGITAVAGNNTGPGGSPERGFEPRFGNLVLHAGPYSDKPPKIKIKSAKVTEIDVGTIPMVFTVKFSKAFAVPVSVDYQTVDDRAIAPGDYVATSGTLTFIPLETEKTITVTINGDFLEEKNERFYVQLSNPINSSISGKGRGKGTIKDNDG